MQGSAEFVVLGLQLMDLFLGLSEIIFRLVVPLVRGKRKSLVKVRTVEAHKDMEQTSDHMQRSPHP